VEKWKNFQKRGDKIWLGDRKKLKSPKKENLPEILKDVKIEKTPF